MRPLPLVVAAGLLLAACGTPDESTPPEPTAPEPLSINEAGLDGYPAGSSFSIDIVRDAFPGYTVTEGEAMSEGVSWTVFHVALDGTELVEIGPDPLGSRVGMVSTTTAAVENVTPFTVGDTFADVFTDAEPDCEPGMEEYSGTVICTAPGYVQIHYIFEGTWNGPDGELPPAEALAGWTISTVFWSLG